MSEVTDVDVVVVGLGPGGEFLANKLARAGLDVVAVDKHLVGGECPYYGCIPSKVMIRSSDALAESRRLDVLAGDVSVEPSWAPVAARVHEQAHGWDDTESVERLEESGATVVRGHGTVVGVRLVEVDGRRFRAGAGVVLATGTDPGVPPIDGLADTPYWTNRDAVKVTELPATLAVIGAGPIGCELTQVFARFGVWVTLLEVAERIMLVEEPETSEVIGSVFAREGIRVMPDVGIERVDHEDGVFRITLAAEVVTADKVLVSAGRHANLPDLGLDSVGVDGEVKALDTDGRMRVRDVEGDSVDWLFAIGDIVGKGLFTHTAKYHAGIVIRQLLGKDGPEADYRAVPRVTFTDPEVGSVGLTEAQAREAGGKIRTSVLPMSASTRAMVHGPGGEGLVKLVADGDLLVGGTVVGPMGGEVLAMLTTAIHGRVPISTLESMIYAYPTWHGDVRTALARLS